LCILALKCDFKVYLYLEDAINKEKKKKKREEKRRRKKKKSREN